MLQHSKTRSSHGRRNLEKLPVSLCWALKSKELGVSWRVCSCTLKRCRKNCQNKASNSSASMPKWEKFLMMVSELSSLLTSVTKITLTKLSIKCKKSSQSAKKLCKTSCQASRRLSHVSTSWLLQTYLIFFQMVTTQQRSWSTCQRSFRLSTDLSLKKLQGVPDQTPCQWFPALVLRLFNSPSSWSC